MFNNYRNPEPPSDSDFESSSKTKSFFNHAFCQSAGSIDDCNSTQFTSAEAIHPSDTDESDLRKLIENDTFLKNASKNDSLSINRGSSPSLILAAGTSEGSTTHNSIASLQSTIINGCLDSDPDDSFYSPNATLTNLQPSTEHLLNERISTDDDFKDCNSSPDNQHSFTTTSTSYKSIRFSCFSNPVSINNNTIFKETDNSAHASSENSDSGVGSNVVPNSSNKYTGLPLHLQHLTTILEESSILSKANSKRFSGLQLIPIIEDLRKGPMPYLPQTEKFNETITTLAQILTKSTREITIEQLSYVLLYTLQTEYSYPSEHLSEQVSFRSYDEISKHSGNESNNTGMELDSIMRELKCIYQSEKNIELESSPDWYTSATATISKTPKDTSNLNKVAQGSSPWRKKEYFPLPALANVESNKENLNLQRTNLRETATDSPKKNKVRFSSEVCQFSNFDKIFNTPQKKKYVATPRWKPSNSITSSDDSLLDLDRQMISEERNSQRNLRRSTSMSNIVTEYSQVLKSAKTPRFAESNAQERKKKYRKRRSKSLETKGHLLVQTNFGSNNDSSSRINTNMPSTSKIQRKIFPNQRNKNCSPKLIVRIGDISRRNTPNGSQVHQKKGKNAKLKSPSKRSSSRKSCGIDYSHIPAVSQLRKVFSPAGRAQGSQERAANIPRITITKSSPERGGSSTQVPIVELQSNRVLRKKSQDKNLVRKPWRP